MRLRHGVLGARQARALARLAPIATEEGFYLAGGTAVALLLGHRVSLDLDWFRPDPFDPLELAEELRDRGLPIRTTAVAPGTLHATLLGTRISFLRYRYPLLRRPLVWSRYGARIASLEDLAAMKLSTVVQRAERKDFVDVYAIGQRMPLGRMLRCYQRRFRAQDTLHVAQALSYFVEADRTRMPRMIWPVTWPAIKRALRAWIETLG